MKRKEFIQLSAVLSLGAAGFISCGSNRRRIPVKIVGANASRGHLLREAKQQVPVETIKKDCVIVGAGVSGLSAARAIMQYGVSDFLVFDLEEQAGGNARHGSNNVSAFPWGAHYIPTPNNDLPEYLQFLQEASVITAIDAAGLPVYNEQYLCFDPQERLFINGSWQEGLVPQKGVPTEEQAQVARFLQQMDLYRNLKCADGKYAFAIPVDTSGSDAAIDGLDQLTMAQWMKREGYTSSYIQEYVNYCCRDDFGTTLQDISAWAGIHYFAGRKGKAVNANHSDVLTWPEGNGFLVNALLHLSAGQLRTGCIVTQVQASADAVLVTYLDTATNTVKAIETPKCILAVPQMVAARLLQDKEREDRVRQYFRYTPWVVVNCRVGKLEEREGAALSWDNVIYGSQSLGYVNATHQLLRQQTDKKNLTWYYPLTGQLPADERKKAQQRNADDWAMLLVEDLQRVHPGIDNAIEAMEVMIWGHAMVQPVPGLIKGSIRSILQQPVANRVHFAHTDLAGISIFEEAFYQGLNAARAVYGKME